jgi:hypothetical protein
MNPGFRYAASGLRVFTWGERCNLRSQNVISSALGSKSQSVTLKWGGIAAKREVVGLSE